MSYAGLKKPDTKGHKLYDPIYMKWPCWDRKGAVVAWGWDGERDEEWLVMGKGFLLGA